MRDRNSYATKEGCMKVIETTIVVTMRVHEARPAMDDDERSYVEGALEEAVRAALSES